MFQTKLRTACPQLDASIKQKYSGIYSWLLDSPIGRQWILLLLANMNTCRPSYKLAFRYQHGPNETEVTRNDVFPCCIFLVKGNLRRLQFIGSLPWLRLNDPKPSTNFQGHFGHSTSPGKKEISTIRIRPYLIIDCSDNPAKLSDS